MNGRIAPPEVEPFEWEGLQFFISNLYEDFKFNPGLFVVTEKQTGRKIARSYIDGDFAIVDVRKFLDCLGKDKIINIINIAVEENIQLGINKKGA